MVLEEDSTQAIVIKVVMVSSEEFLSAKTKKCAVKHKYYVQTYFIAHNTDFNRHSCVISRCCDILLGGFSTVCGDFFKWLKCLIS